MIINLFIYVVVSLLSIVILPLRLLPDVTVEGPVGSAIATGATYIALFQTMVPLSTVFTILGIVFFIELAIFTYKVIMWVIRRFPTQS